MTKEAEDLAAQLAAARKTIAVLEKLRDELGIDVSGGPSRALLTITLGGAVQEITALKADLDAERALAKERAEVVRRLKADFAVNKDAWRQHYEREADVLRVQLAMEQRAWFAGHLNDEVTDEREACAQLADTEADRIKHDANFFGLGEARLEKVAHHIAAAIRARGGA